MNTTKVLFVGLGSIGRRHLCNLKSIASELEMNIETDALRYSDRPLPQDIAPLISRSYSDAKELDFYDAIFICNPTDKHIETLLALKDNASNFFVEKPWDVRPSTDDELSLLEGKKLYVACPLRHTRLFEVLNRFVRANRILSARIICSSYLPEWRPESDYRTLYCANPKNGGVKLDLIHDFDYTIALFGYPSEYMIYEAKVSPLEMETCDVASAMLRFSDKIVELHLDYFGRISQRKIELFTPDEVAVFDFISSKATFQKAGTIFDLKEAPNDKYLDEMRKFLRMAFKNDVSINDAAHANRLMRFILQEEI